MLGCQLKVFLPEQTSIWGKPVLLTYTCGLVDRVVAVIMRAVSLGSPVVDI